MPESKPAPAPDTLGEVPPELANNPLIVLLRTMDPAQDELFRGLADEDAADEAAERTAAR